MLTKSEVEVNPPNGSKSKYLGQSGPSLGEKKMIATLSASKIYFHYSCISQLHFIQIKIFTPEPAVSANVAEVWLKPMAIGI